MGSFSNIQLSSTPVDWLEYGWQVNWSANELTELLHLYNMRLSQFKGRYPKRARMEMAFLDRRFKMPNIEEAWRTAVLEPGQNFQVPTLNQVSGRTITDLLYAEHFINDHCVHFGYAKTFFFGEQYASNSHRIFRDFWTASNNAADIIKTYSEEELLRDIINQEFSDVVRSARIENKLIKFNFPIKLDIVTFQTGLPAPTRPFEVANGRSNSEKLLKLMPLSVPVRWKETEENEKANDLAFLDRVEWTPQELPIFDEDHNLFGSLTHLFTAIRNGFTLFNEYPIAFKNTT